jgi:hypothetical protein
MVPVLVFLKELKTLSLTWEKFSTVRLITTILGISIEILIYNTSDFFYFTVSTSVAVIIFLIILVGRTVLVYKDYPAIKAQGFNFIISMFVFEYNSLNFIITAFLKKL